MLSVRARPVLGPALHKKQAVFAAAGPGLLPVWKVQEPAAGLPALVCGARHLELLCHPGVAIGELGRDPSPREASCLISPVERSF